MPGFGLECQPVYFDSSPGNKAEGQSSDDRGQAGGVMQDACLSSQTGGLKILQVQDIRCGKKNTPEQQEYYARPYTHLLSS